MTSTRVVLPAAQRPRLATGYGRRMPDGARAIMPFTDCDGITPAANLSSNVEDFARFASLQFRDGKAGGSQILKGSTLREMHRIHWLQPDWKRGWGLGFHVWRLGERTLVGHGGSLGGYRTQTAISVSDKIAVLVMANADDGDPARYIEQAFEVIAPAIGKAAAPAPKPPQADPAWNRYTGKYRNAWGDTTVLVMNGQLVMFAPTGMDPKGALTRLIPDGEHTFRIEGEDGYAALGERVRFELGANGKVARVKVAENYTYPLGESR